MGLVKIITLSHKLNGTSLFHSFFKNVISRGRKIEMVILFLKETNQYY